MVSFYRRGNRSTEKLCVSRKVIKLIRNGKKRFMLSAGCQAQSRTFILRIIKRSRYYPLLQMRKPKLRELSNSPSRWTLLLWNLAPSTVLSLPCSPSVPWGLSRTGVQTAVPGKPWEGSSSRRRAGLVTRQQDLCPVQGGQFGCCMKG